MIEMKSNTTKLVVILISLAFSFQLMYQPLPDDFEQPWKYRIVCFGAEMSNIFGYYFELLGIAHRVNVTRFSYHYAVGAYNIRDEKDQISVHDEEVEHLSIRIYRPISKRKQILENKNETLPTIFFYHGGGYFVGSADTLEPVTYLMAKYTQYLVIYIDYRLIPEHKYPAAHQDSIDAAKYLIKNYEKYSIDLQNIILMGDSAGGNLAAVVGQQLMEANILNPKMQVLIYPILQFFDFTLPSYRINLSKRVLGNIFHDNFKIFLHYFTGYEIDDSVFYNGHTSIYHKESMLSEYVNPGYIPHKYRNHNLENISYMNDTDGRYEKMAEILLSHKVSPLLVDDDYLRMNTPEHTFLLTTGIDILRDDGFIYAERLKKLGKKILHNHHENLFHGIFGLLHGPLEFKRAHYLIKYVADHVKQVILV